MVTEKMTYMNKFIIAKRIDVHPQTVTMWLCRAEFAHVPQQKVNGSRLYGIRESDLERLSTLIRRPKNKRRGKANGQKRTISK